MDFATFLYRSGRLTSREYTEVLRASHGVLNSVEAPAQDDLHFDPIQVDVNVLTSSQSELLKSNPFVLELLCRPPKKQSLEELLDEWRAAEQAVQQEKSTTLETVSHDEFQVILDRMEPAVDWVDSASIARRMNEGLSR